MGGRGDDPDASGRFGVDVVHQPSTILRHVDEIIRSNELLAGAGRPDVPGLRFVPPPGHESAES